MRISMVSEHASPLATPGSVDAGGQNVHVAALASALAARGHTVTVYTRRDDAALPTRVSMGEGVDVVHVSAGPAERVPKDELLPYMGEFAEGLAEAWSFDAPDVVHSHFWMSGVAALDGVRGLAAGVARPPVLHTFHALGTVKRRHQGDADTSPAERVWLEPRVGRQADVVIATCEDEVRELRELGVAPQRIEVAPCGVDLGVFRSRGRAERRGARFRVLSVGRLVPRKGVDLVVRAIALLRERGVEDVELEVVGTSGVGEPDPEIQRLAALSEELGVTEQVHLRGRVPREEIPSLIRSADVVACTPWYEPFGIVPLESMACGRPVVAAAVGGLADSVVDGVTGLLVPPRDPAAIADALATLLADETLRRRMGAAGRERVEARYAWERVAATTEQIYERALGGSQPGLSRLEGVAL